MDISDLKLHHNKGIIQHINLLMFERIAGTKGETKAINYIQKELNNENVDNILESFKWSKTIDILVKSIAICIFWSTILFEVTILLNLAWLMVILDLFFIGVIYFLVINFYDMTHLMLLGKRKKSKNIIAKVSAVEKKDKSPLIIFTAHYDSISAKYPYNLKKFFYLLVITISFPIIFSTLIISEWTVLTYFFDSYKTNSYAALLSKSIDFSHMSLIFLIVAILILLFNRERSQSLGSIDNASGVSILIELAKILNKNPLKHIDIIFLWSGAEEWGLWGSKQFCIKHFDELNEEYDLNKSYNINIDMVGTYVGLLNKTGIIRKKETEKLINFLDSSAKKLNVPLDKYNLALEPRSDHNTFRSFAKKTRKKMQSCCFLSNQDSKYIHSSRDTPNKCSSKNLNWCVDICYDAIKNLDLETM